MLRSLTLPASGRAALDTFRPAFRRSSTFAVFALLATGLVAQAGRRTVVGMLAGVGVAAAVSFHSACRFFSRHTWDADRIGLALARLVVDRLLGEHAPIMVVVDDTLIRRWGPKVFGAFWTHDGSAQDPNALGRGNRWVDGHPRRRALGWSRNCARLGGGALRCCQELRGEAAVRIPRLRRSANRQRARETERW